MPLTCSTRSWVSVPSAATVTTGPMPWSTTVDHGRGQVVDVAELPGRRAAPSRVSSRGASKWRVVTVSMPRPTSAAGLTTVTSRPGWTSRAPRQHLLHRQQVADQPLVRLGRSGASSGSGTGLSFDAPYVMALVTTTTCAHPGRRRRGDQRLHPAYRLLDGAPGRRPAGRRARSLLVATCTSASTSVRAAATSGEARSTTRQVAPRPCRAPRPGR